MNLLKKEFQVSWLKIIMIIFITFIWSYFFVNIKSSNENYLNPTNNSFEEQYNTAKKWWNLLDICTMSKIVKTSYMQANDDENYAKWMKISEDDCNKLLK